MVLDTTDQYVSDWDDYSSSLGNLKSASSSLGTRLQRSVPLGSSLTASPEQRHASWLSTIIYDNATLLNGSKKTSREVLTVRFLSQVDLAFCDLREGEPRRQQRA